MPSSNISQYLDAGMIKALSQAGDLIMRAAQQNVSSNNLPSAIADAMELGMPTRDAPGRYSIDISIDVSPGGPAPMAAAFELGSGIHGEKGAKYPITPKKYPVSFTFKSGDRGYFPVGPITFLHPGVPARPYLAPAAKDNETKVAEIIAEATLEAVSVAFDVILT